LLQKDPIRDQIVAAFDKMPSQLRQAARYILDHPGEVPLVSMRELSRLAGVQPATMTRLAKFLGLTGFEDLRASYAAALRSRVDGLTARALRTADQTAGAEGIAPRMMLGLSAQIARLGEPDTLARMQAVADRLASARRVFVLGLRACHLVAWHFSYVATLLGEQAVHLDGPAGTSGDGLMRAAPGDAMLVISIDPYSRQTIELTELARAKGVAIVTITDSEISPLVALSEHAIFCATESQGFFHTLVPLLAVSEVLCALLASRNRAKAVASLQNADKQLLELNTYVNEVPRRYLPPS
jgi:DNA-binding MurR/RpiR family transcriptional regulator